MCGIFGYAGPDARPEVLLEGIKRLEYRGYDSWGLCLAEADHLSLVRRVGRISGVEAVGPSMDGFGAARSGIAHTRWATHGAPTEINAHPHVDCTGRVAVIHNGIIENHAMLRSTLKANGHTFTSQTDTEVIPHLIEEMLKTEKDFTAAFLSALKLLAGAYGIAALWAGTRTRSTWRGMAAPSSWAWASPARWWPATRPRWWPTRGTSSTWTTARRPSCTRTGSRRARWKGLPSARPFSRLPSACRTSSGAATRISC